MGSVASTIFWNMVLFLQGKNKSILDTELQGTEGQKIKGVLEVQGQIGSDDADVMEVLHGLELPLLETLEDVHVL